MIVDYFLTDADGRIVATGKCHYKRVAMQSRTGATAHVGVADETQWWDGSQLVAREDWTPPADAQIAADGVNSVVMPIPHGARCWILGPRVVPEWIQVDATMKFSTTVAGAYQLTIDAANLLPKVVTIEAAL